MKHSQTIVDAARLARESAQEITTLEPDATVTVVTYRSILIVVAQDDNDPEPSVWVPIMALQAISLEFALAQIEAFLEEDI